MGLQVVHGNILDVQADAIILTIDGTAPKQVGNIALAFARRWPEVWQEVEDTVRYPVPLGTAVDIEVEPGRDCPFRLMKEDLYAVG